MNYSIDRELARIRKLLQKNNILEAEIVLKKISTYLFKDKITSVQMENIESALKKIELDISNKKIKNIIKLFEQKKYTEIEKKTDFIRDNYPDNSTLLNILGASYIALNKHKKASKVFRKIVQLDKKNVSALNNYGLALKNEGNLHLALEQFNKANLINPSDINSLNNLGVTYKDLNQIDKSISALEKAIKLAPENFGIYNNFGNSLLKNCQYDKAIYYFKESIKINPNYAPTYNNIGTAFLEKGNYSKANYFFHTAIKIDKRYTVALNNLGTSYNILNQTDKAIKYFNDAIKIQKNYSEPYFNLGLTYLLKLNFEVGFRFYEWRWQTKDRKDKYFRTNKPIWRAENEKVILIWAEQGIGDEIMFSSLLNECSALSNKLLIVCDKRLIPLLKRSLKGNILFFDDRKLIRDIEFDFQISMGSLPQLFRKCLNDFQKSGPSYLKCRERFSEKLRKKILNGHDKKIIGISWHSEASGSGAGQRNIQLEELVQYLAFDNCILISLQYGDVSDEVWRVNNKYKNSIKVIDEIDCFNQVDDLASLIFACDRVVSIDNMTVHLAGALGVPTEVLLPLNRDWRWSMHSERSYWYTSLRLHHQSKEHEWATPLKRVRDVIQTQL
jgi:tetratricopeptide (TPR) repeat protein